MADKRPVDELSTEELERILAIRKREERLKRVRRMRADGRLVEATQLERADPPPLPRPEVEPAGATLRYGTTAVKEQRSWISSLNWGIIPSWISGLNLRWVGNRFLFFIELVAIVGLAWIIWETWQTRQELNREVAQAQRKEIQEEFPTPEPTPLISVVVLPGGHTSPIEPGGSRPVEAGGIPEHLLPRVNAYQPPPIPTPGPEHPRRIVVDAIGVDHPVVLGDNEEQLKKGVGHHIGSANPGDAGNVVLTAHNDIYGEIFRRLDDLQLGDQIVIHTLSRRYVYRVQSFRIVDPFEVSVMYPTRKPTVTLISCYPYLVDTQRYVVIGVLDEE